MDNFETNESTDENQTPDLNLDEPVLVQAQIAGFWKRILAFSLDTIIIAIIGFGLGTLFFDHFVAMGDWGRFIGLAIFLAYFGLLNSKLGGGQTLGKRVAKIRVSNEVGEPISVWTSILRALILGLPGMFNGMSISSGSVKSPLDMVFEFTIGVIIFAGGIGILYFYIFNRNTRQSLHDLICGTYVISAVGSGPVQVEPIWTRHYVIYGILLTLIVGGSIAADIITERLPFFKETMAVNNQVGSMEGVYGSSVMQGMIYSSGGQHKFLTINVNVRDKRLMTQQYASKITVAAMQENLGLAPTDQMKVILSYGYNIGITTGFKYYSEQFSLEEWQKMGRE